jgi:hypothetical protein
VVFEAEVDDGLAPDLIVWLPDAAADLGAPILIEVERAMRWARGRDEIAARWCAIWAPLGSEQA